MTITAILDKIVLSWYNMEKRKGDFAMRKKLLSLLLLIVMLVSVIPVSKTIAAEKIKLNKVKAVLEVDAKLALKLGDIAATDVKWSSSAKKVATVTSKGVVTAKGEGDATITATYNKKKYTCKVTVVDSNKEEVEEDVVLYEDDNVKIYFKGIGEKGVEFWIENLTDINITIQADSVSINGISTNDIMMSDDVAPKSKGKVVARCSDFSDVKNVRTVGGQLRIIDFASWETYDATFVNIKVN